MEINNLSSLAQLSNGKMIPFLGLGTSQSKDVREGSRNGH